MRKGMLAGAAAGLSMALANPYLAIADEDRPPPPNEQQILVEEVPALARRSTLLSFPDQESALAALATMPDGGQDVIAMHLGRLHPTRHEFLPGLPPLVDLLVDRGEKLTDPDGAHLKKNLEDMGNGQFGIMMLPVDATTAIVILPTMTVESDPDATPLPEERVDLGGVTYEFNGGERTVDTYMADGATNAIGFMHNGKYVYDDFANGFDPETRQQVWSVTKSTTTAMVGIAEGEGLVDISKPITHYIPELIGTAWDADPVNGWRATTVEDILQMESGTYWVDVPIHQPEELVLMGLDFHTNGAYGMTRNDYLKEMTRVAQPGDHYRYNSGDTQVLTWMLENIYARPENGGYQSYAQLLSDKLWKPAGMESDALIMVDRTGAAFASMGLHATTKDMARFGELFRNGGKSLDGRQVVPADWVARSHNYDRANPDHQGGDRGYMWAKFPESGDTWGYSAVGYGHQRVSVVPDWKMVGVRFGNDPTDLGAPQEFEAVYRAIAAHLGENNPAPGLPAYVAPRPEEPARPTNRRRDPQGPRRP